MSEKKIFIVNLVSSISVFCVTTAVSFFLSPYIVHTLGVEANGFVSLASNFSSYISLVTVALNSMSGRFITIASVNGETDKATSYYTSVFWANIVLFAAMLIPVIAVIIKLDSLIDIPAKLVFDVKILFCFVFANLMLANLLSLWNNTFYVLNTLYKEYAMDMVAEFARAGLIVLFFSLLTPRVWYMTLAGLVVVPVKVVWSLWNKAKYLPGLRIDNTKFSFAKLKEIISSGIWRTLQSTGEMLMTGLDLVICNIFIDATAMGVMALSKTVLLITQKLNYRITQSFAPKLTINYAQDRKDIIEQDLRRSFKIVSIIGALPLGGLLVFGKDFFQLWVPSQDASVLQTLSMLACFTRLFDVGLQPIGNVFAATNKVKPLAISVIISGVVNTAVVFLAVKYTSYGIYAVAGASVVIGILRNMCYTIPAAARYLGFPWHRFFIGVWYSVVTSGITILAGLGVKCLIAADSWLHFLVACALTAMIAFVAGSFAILSKQERGMILKMAQIAIRKVKMIWKA